MPLVETDCTIVDLPVLLALGTKTIFDTQFGKVAVIAEGCSYSYSWGPPEWVSGEILGFKQTRNRLTKEVT